MYKTDKSIEIEGMAKKTMYCIMRIETCSIAEEEIFDVMADAVYEPTREKVNNIYDEYKGKDDRAIFGYFENRMLTGIVAIRIKEIVEI